MPTVSFNPHLPDYEVVAELGRGNARVLKARHIATGDVVAIKQYAFATDADLLRRFERESQIMTRIDHPNIVRVREVQLGAAMPYVVMDFVEGGDLRSLLRQKGHLDMLTTIRLGLQLTGAFRAMHPMQVIHRDIKPENILYRPLASGELHFLLTDFGIAKLRADESTRTRTGQSLMTYEYAAPEQFDNPRQVDEAADYYALGVVLFECLTGQVPFVLQNETGLAFFMQQVLTAPLPAPVLPSGQPLPPSLATLLTSLLVRSPQHRLHNTDQLELLLEQSRLEYLKANRATPMGPAATTQTVAGPVARPAAMPKQAVNVADEPEEGLEPVTTNTDWKWWGLAGVVLAAGLTYGLYSRAPHPSVDRSTKQINSVRQTEPSYQPVDAEVTPDTSATTGSNDDQESMSNPVDPAPAPQPGTDTTVNRRTVTDSVAVMPTDTTQ